ncbi:MAG: pyridoxamine 5'-phosphate oxidase family protein [Christensenella sp.]|uniref:pyridoxamine 5'-phosphate oxidase family protein n=1 Tax=Christensenella sp. TaxID=1935934 RepID=UPI002B20F038|nr:pyridoxamine 5'-phosphate oxidase family protein [Christensenella sp.]MEA5004253.1 pyridoxamine 5'-phosphate oxidase family protein [Christensenella sp.]
MQKEQIYDLMNQNPGFFLATIDGANPRVRGMLLYKADQEGIVFHTGKMKDIYRQILASPHAELCFVDQKSGMQVRVSGTLEIVEDRALKEEITAHPSRAFLRTWKDNGEMENFYETLVVMRMAKGKAKVWTMATNFESTPEIAL